MFSVRIPQTLWFESYALEDYFSYTSFYASYDSRTIFTLILGPISIENNETKLCAHFSYFVSILGYAHVLFFSKYVIFYICLYKISFNFT